MEYRMDRQQIGTILTSLRKERGETLSEVAEAVGASQSAISMYEKGVRIPRDEIKIKISQHYGVPVESIFYAPEQHDSCYHVGASQLLPRPTVDPLNMRF
jgi:transcriptional regulator with XRE-family HTH domain